MNKTQSIQFMGGEARWEGNIKEDDGSCGGRGWVQSFLISQSHRRATGPNFPDFALNLEICMRKLKIYAF